MLYPVYTLIKYIRGSPPENNSSPRSKWGAVALGVDGLFCSALLIISALSIAAALAHINQLQFLANQYPVLSYVFIGVPVAAGFVDLILLLVKKGRASSTNATETLIVEETETFLVEEKAGVKPTNVRITKESPTIPHELIKDTKIKYPVQASAEEELFRMVDAMDPEEYDDVMAKWDSLEWFQKLDAGVQRDFKQVLNLIKEFNIEQQLGLFKTDEAKNETYQFFKKSIIFLYDKVKDNAIVGPLIVVQLSLIKDRKAHGSCPLAFRDGFLRALFGVIGKTISGTAEEQCREKIYQLFSMRRAEIVEKMAQVYGEAPHIHNRMTALIGEERSILGHQFTIDDNVGALLGAMQSSLTYDKILYKFDSQLTPQSLIEWFYGKINGFDGTFCLNQEIPAYLADYFNIDINEANDIVFDENYYVKIEAIIATLFLVGILKHASEDPEEVARRLLFDEEK